MDIVFNCPNCDQELEVDSSAAGAQLNCPACQALITVPEPESPLPKEESPAEVKPSIINPIAASAAAKQELHLKVPVREGPSEVLIQKPKPPLEAAAKGDKKIRIKTIRHTDCIEVGHDRFDEMVTQFLQKVGEDNIISITPLTYTHLDIGTQKLLTDYAVMIVYRG